MKVYTDAEYDRLYKESLFCEQIKSNYGGFNVVKAAKCQWSEIQYRFAKLPSGIDLDLTDERILVDCNQRVEHEDCAILTAKFYLSGYSSVICPGIEGIEPKYEETGKQNYLFYLPDIKEIEQEWANDRIKLLRMNINVDTIRRFVTELNNVPRQLQRLIEDEHPQRFHFNVGDITSQMEAIIGQIWHHPYQGAIAQIYLEAKVLELLALQLSQLSESKSELATSTLKPQSIDRIYQAKNILATNLENPPSILELTQQVGISELTLRRGFRELFGMTAIQYLTQKRMEQAELLLREQEISVAEVANLVGYTHLGYFAKVFKRQFGITPSECLIGRICEK